MYNMIPFGVAPPNLSGYARLSDLAAYAPANRAGNNGTRIVSGGSVRWISGYQYQVSATEYYIENVAYSSTGGLITLADSDQTNDRIDVIALNTAGEVVTITGEALATPARPDVDPSLYVLVTFVYVPAQSTEPVINEAEIYLENAEWTITPSAGSIVTNSTNNPRTGTKCIEGTSVAKNVEMTAVAGSPFSLTAYDYLVFYIRLKAAFGTSKAIQLQWKNGTTTTYGSAVSVSNGKYGFNRSIIDAYQQIIVPLSDFAVSPNVTVDRLQIVFTGSGTITGFYMDDMILQAGAYAPIEVTPMLSTRGAWSATAGYAINDVVTLNGYTYLCLLANTNKNPTSNPGYWGTIAVPLSAGAVGIGFEETQKPAASGVYNLIVPYDLQVPSNCAGSSFYNKTNPTAQVVVSIKDDGTEIATLTVATNGTPTWATAGGAAKTIASGSRLGFVFPAQDDTWAGVAITLIGTRTT